LGKYPPLNYKLRGDFLTSAISTRCTVCQHPDREALDAKLVAGVASRPLAMEYNLNYKAVQNHKNKHLPQTLIKSQALQDEQGADRLLARIEDLYGKALLLIEKADTDQKWQAATGAIKEARSCLELTAKLIGTLKTGHTINITYNTEFVQARVAIYEALLPFPEAREAVILALEEGGVIDAE
jgi:hypothetical protein